VELTQTQIKRFGTVQVRAADLILTATSLCDCEFPIDGRLRLLNG